MREWPFKVQPADSSAPAGHPGSQGIGSAAVAPTLPQSHGLGNGGRADAPPQTFDRPTRATSG